MRCRIAAGLLAGFLLTAPAWAETVTPDSRAAARELVQVARVTDQFKMLFPAIMESLRPAFVQNRPEVERDFNALLPLLSQLVNDRVGALADEFAELYAATYTADELRQLIAFYRQPVGQKFLATMPTLAQQGMAIGQRFGQQIGAEAVRRIREELRKRGHDL